MVKFLKLRNSFAQGQYNIEFKGNVVSFANAVWGGWELIERTQLAKDHFNATIKLLGNNTLNNYLKALLDHVEIVNVNKVIPSMNDIFIESVSKKTEDKTEEINLTNNTDNNE